MAANLSSLKTGSFISAPVGPYFWSSTIREHTLADKRHILGQDGDILRKYPSLALKYGQAALLSLDSFGRRVYRFWIHFLLRSNVMAHKKIERAKELHRRRHRRAQRLKARIREAKAAK